MSQSILGAESRNLETISLRVPVELALLGGLEGDVAQPNADVDRLVGDVEIITILKMMKKILHVKSQKVY